MNNFLVGQFYQNKNSHSLYRCMIIIQDKVYLKKLNEETGTLIGDYITSDYTPDAKWIQIPSENIPQKYFYAREEK